MEILRSKLVIFITWLLWLYTVTIESELYTIVLLVIASIIALIFDAVRSKKAQATIAMSWFPYFILLLWILCFFKLTLFYLF